MKKINLLESMEMQVITTTYNLDIVFQNMIAGWKGLHLSELSALLAYTHFLSQLHHTNHWISSGDYGDHLLFQRLYECVNEELDSLGEKVIGLGSNKNVDMCILTSQCNKWCNILNTLGAETVSTGSSLIKKSLEAELLLIKLIDLTRTMLKNSGSLSTGLDNMLAGLSDTHESSIYLLKQRLANKF